MYVGVQCEKGLESQKPRCLIALSSIKGLFVRLGLHEHQRFRAGKVIQM